MKLMSYRVAGADSYGAATEAGVVDLARRLPGHPTLQALIAADGLAAARAAVGASPTPDHSFDQIEFLPPVAQPEKIFCIGVNYAERNAEYKDASDLPRYPSVFMRNPRSFVGHGAPLERPQVSEQFDYEGEIVLVIGRGGRHIRQADALGHVFGLTLCNEGSVRDWLRHGKFNVTQGKNFDRSGSIGPWIVTADALDLTKPLTLTTRVGGAVRQHDTTARLMFPFPRLIAYLSTFATLAPGDLIVTGTPTGAGAHHAPPLWLKPGEIGRAHV